MSPPNFAFCRLFFMLTISFLTTFISEPTGAAPVQGTSTSPLSPRDLPPISVKYFLDRLVATIRPDTCVFYYHLGQEARAWAKTKTPRLNTVWWSFDPNTYLRHESPLRDYVDADKEIAYWEVMCEAYTRACGGDTWVLIKPEDPNEPNDSIWTRVEYATIKKQEPGIVKVDRAGPNGKKVPPNSALGLLLGGKAGGMAGAKAGGPPSPMGGQPSMYQNGPPGGS